MQKQYRVVVPFGGNKAGRLLEARDGSYGHTVLLAYAGNGGSYWIPSEFISDKVEEVKPKALRKWLVEEVATREEASVANGVRKMYLNPESMTMHGEFSGNAVEASVWVKITEQKEEKRWVPKVGDTYWAATKAGSLSYIPVELRWNNERSDLLWLARGDLFKTREECQDYIDSKKKAA